MQTFFVTYNTGEYDSYVNHIYAFDAESKEKLYEEISNSYDNYVIYCQKYQNERQKINDLYLPKNKNTLGENTMKKYREELDKFFVNYPYPMFTVLGYNISMFDEFHLYEKEKVFKSADLQIHTIDEYISYCRPEKIDIQC